MSYLVSHLLHKAVSQSVIHGTHRGRRDTGSVGKVGLGISIEGGCAAYHVCDPIILEGGVVMAMVEPGTARW